MMAHTARHSPRDRRYGTIACSGRKLARQTEVHERNAMIAWLGPRTLLSDIRRPTPRVIVLAVAAGALSYISACGATGSTRSGDASEAGAAADGSSAGAGRGSGAGGVDSTSGAPAVGGAAVQGGT